MGVQIRKGVLDLETHDMLLASNKLLSAQLKNITKKIGGEEVNTIVIPQSKLWIIRRAKKFHNPCRYKLHKFY